jgi:hypothetical protein
MNVRSNRTKHFSKRTKIITICTVAVLILAGAGIAVAIANNNNNTVSTVDSNEPGDNHVEFMPVSSKERTNETSDVMPATGASSAAVLALVAGSATTAASYYLLAKH